jgi:serine/threonine-protein kinase HipA
VSSPTAFVALDLHGVSRPIGTLYVHSARGRESATFEYERSWIDAPDHFALAPALTVTPGPFFTMPGHALFGALSDSAPDRWGQTLMRRAERRRAKAAGTAPRTLRAVDFLLGVTDTVRQGALRFRTSADGDFVAPERAGAIPPLVELPRLLAATDRFLVDEDSDDDLRLLLAPGSSLGGARPKASVRDIDGTLLIAKFPKPDDEIRVGAWEAVALDLAAAAGIAVPTYRLESVAGREVLLVTRFDRLGSARIPYLSAMSMLEAFDGDMRSYVDIADALRAHGASAAEDLHELWRRVVFSVLISNTDDHLRNHGVLYAGTAGWRLSPVFDINPVPVDIKPRFLSTSIGSDGDPTASLELALEVALYFDLTADEARVIMRTVGKAVKTWRRVAARRGLRRDESDRMETAFEHTDLAAALA